MKTFFGRYALLILCLVFFAVPFALRGARMSLETMENNVKDWLPSNFDETAELEWFGRHFMGEQFILVTWDGCTADDQSYRWLVEKINAEVKPQQDIRPGAIDESKLTLPERLELRKLRQADAARRLGDELGLYVTGEYHEDWGGLQEKWIKDQEDRWYFITPDGDLYRWAGGNHLLGWMSRTARRAVGAYTLEGEHLGQFGDPSVPEDRNDFHDDPRRLSARLFSSITTGPQVLAELSAELWPRGVDMSDEERAEEARKLALQRLTGTLYGPDGEQTCIVVTLSKQGKQNKRRVVGRGLLGKPKGKLVQLAQEAGITPPPLPPMLPFVAEAQPGGRVLRMGGPPIDNVAIDEEGEITLVRLVGFSMLLGLVLSYFSFRSIKITIMVFLVGGISAVSSLAIVYWGGGSVDAILMSMPSLVYVLGLSGAVHIVNYYRDAVKEEGVEGAPERALSHGWWPCTLAAITTSLGLLSLCMAQILPIQKFGLYAAAGVMATLVLLFTYLPSALQIWAPDATRSADLAPRGLEAWIGRFWDWIGSLVIRRHGWVTIGCLVMLVVFAAGLLKIDTDIQLLKLFDKDAKIIRDYTWLEQNIGNLVPMELVARIGTKQLAPVTPPEGEVTDEERIEQQLRYSFLERMELAEHIREAVDRTFGPAARGVVGDGVSAGSFAPDLPDPTAHRMRLLLNTKLADNRDRILAEDYLAVDEKDESELWRISLRLGALNDVDYGEFVSSLRDAVEPVLTAYQYRDQALRRLIDERGPETLQRSRVYVLGMANPALPQDESEEPSRPLKTVAESKGEIEPMRAEEQAEIFADTLHDLFVSRGYRTRSKSSKMIGWHDPATQPLETMGNQSDKWAEWLGTFDCLIVAENHPDYDLPFIRKVAEEKGIVLIDATDYHFSAAANELTAKSRELPVNVTYTGVVPIVYKAQRTLLKSLITSIFWAFVMIAAVMMVLLRVGKFGVFNMLNISGGMISMLPNVFPVIVIFGIMGHLDILVDIGSMMTASVAMGVAVDDTIHFLTWFRNGMQQGMTRHDSIRQAYRRVATAMTQTTLIGGLGLSVFALSTFTPTQRFGILMLALLVAALVGDLIFLPALLAGPLGKLFSRPDLPEEESTERLVIEQPAAETHAATTTPHSRASARRNAILRRDKAH